MDLLQLESIIATQLRVRLTKMIGSDYPKLSFSTEITDETPSFPNVYIHELAPSEVGMSIPNQTIHAVRDTIQIEVSTDTSKADGRRVANACLSIMKTLRYSAIALPIYVKNNNIHRFVFRVRRVVASGDTF